MHRDIKPANVFVREPGGTAVVGDFGLAFVEGVDRQTATGEVVGAWFFMAPEMEDGGSIWSVRVATCTRWESCSTGC